jgi:Ni,Fe-hydrogenase III component G
MGALTDIARHSGKVEALRRWPRATVTSDIWRRLTKELVDARATLLGLWGDASAVHMALIEEPSAEIAVFTLPCPDGKFPSVGAHHPPAIRLERTIRDLYGFKPVGLTDTRPWLDLGCWGVTQPLGAKKRARKAQEAYAFLPVEGEDLHQIPERASTRARGLPDAPPVIAPWLTRCPSPMRSRPRLRSRFRHALFGFAR